MTVPACPFLGLDSLWIQVAGSSCNLRCAHCFNRSGPGNRDLEPLGPEHLLCDCERLAAQMRAEKIAEPFVETIETGWWTTCLEILPAKERARGRF